MCSPITLFLIGTAIKGIGAIAQAKQEGTALKQEAAIRNQQLAQDIEAEKIKAMSEANERAELHLRLVASNNAMEAASGVENFSLEQGIGVYNKEVAYQDIASIAYNKDLMVGRLSQQIKVNTFQANRSARQIKKNAYFKIASDVIGGASRLSGASPEAPTRDPWAGLRTTT